MTYSSPKFDDFSGTTDDDKFVSIMASSALEVVIDRAVTVTQTISPRSFLTIRGLGKLAWMSTAPASLTKTTTGDLFYAPSTLLDFHVKDLSMLGNDVASRCVSLVNSDECSVENCLVKNFTSDGIYFSGSQTVRARSYNNRVSASINRDGSARGIFFVTGNAANSTLDYVANYATGCGSSASEAVIQDIVVETADNAIRVSGADCVVRGGLFNACTKTIVQAGSYWVMNDFARNAYPANCVISDPTKWIANWNGA